MAQIPPPGSSKRQLAIPDHLIDNLSVSVSNIETGKFYFNKEHKFLPACVVVDLTTEANYHVNIYLKGITHIANWATGSITLAGGTTAANLSGDTFTLIDKDAKSQTFTFNNSDNVVTGGSIGLLSATDEATIIARTKSSINNISNLDITAGAITAGSSTNASVTDAIIFTAFAVDDETLTMVIPASYGADAGKTITIVFQNTAGMSGTPTANQIFVHQGAGTAAGIINLKRAINGFSNEATIKYGSGIAGGATNGISSVTALDGTTAARLTIKADIAGPLGNSITLATTVTGATVISPLTGGTTTQTLEVVQDVTGSDGNTTINLSAVTGGSSVNFKDGTNYGSGSYAANESFTGDLKIRAISLRNQYLM